MEETGLRSNKLQNLRVASKMMETNLQFIAYNAKDSKVKESKIPGLEARSQLTIRLRLKERHLH